MTSATPTPGTTTSSPGPLHHRVPYKWIVLSCTTFGVLVAMINFSSLLIALPAIFRGIHLNPLDPGNFTYLLWILMGYGLVSAALVVTAGRIGDMYGRVRMFKIGFVIFTGAAVGLSLVWGTGAAGAVQIIAFRMIQAVGGSMMMANSAAIITDAFPSDQRGMALGINGVSLLAGSFIGLIAGGLLAAVDWRLVFAVNVPVGLLGIAWAFWQLREIGERHPARIDWAGNLTFAAGLATVLTGITYGIKPYGASNMGWANPFVIGMIAGGLALLVAFVFIERRVADPMFHLALFRIRAFAAGNLAVVLSSLANSGMQFMLIMWLQGIWLPLHGYSFERTPLWAGIYMLPLTTGFLVAGPVSGILSDRYGARPFATAGMLLGALSFLLLIALPADFAYWSFALVIFLNGIAFGMFAAPNTAAIMNSVPARDRGVASGMRATSQMLGQPLSIGIFFSLMVVGLTAHVPAAMFAGLSAQHVPAQVAAPLSHMPPTGYLFAAFLGFNPLKELLGAHVLGALPLASAHTLVSKAFFPLLIARPFKDGIVDVLLFAAAMCTVAALASWLRGGKFVHEEAHAAHGHGLERAARRSEEPSRG
ncbi:MAG TPA: MFS transporter [Thermoleophilia bacterium]|nr:MFS transporter [Thermoleophilia bacterium]